MATGWGKDHPGVLGCVTSRWLRSCVCCSQLLFVQVSMESQTIPEGPGSIVTSTLSPVDPGALPRRAVEVECVCELVVVVVGAVVARPLPVVAVIVLPLAVVMPVVVAFVVVVVVVVHQRRRQTPPFVVVPMMLLSAAAAVLMLLNL